MGNRVKFRPNYERLYPGLEIDPEVLDFLKKSDMKMEYQDYHRKRRRPVKNDNGDIIAYLPGIEVSLEHLIENGACFADDSPGPEALNEEKEEINALYSGINVLNTNERRLINALFFENMTLREYADISGLSKSKIDRDKKKILDKLRNYLINNHLQRDKVHFRGGSN